MLSKKRGYTLRMKKKLALVVIVLLIIGLGFYTFVSKETSDNAENPGARLTTQNWTWLSTTYSGNNVIAPKVPSRFVMTFTKAGTFTSTTDCNNLSGNYGVKGNRISFFEMFSTQMYCEGSIEVDFVKTLSDSKDFKFSDKGVLTINLKSDEGIALFN